MAKVPMCGTALVQRRECLQVASAQHASTMQVILQVYALVSCSRSSYLHAGCMHMHS